MLSAAPPAELVAERLTEVRKRVIEAGGDPGSMRIVAVTKGFDASAPAAALAVGLQDVGENYADEFLSKAEHFFQAGAASAPHVVWHMLGAIQRRKVKELASVVGCWQTLSRPVEITSIARYQPGASVFVQVATTQLPGRNGATAADTPRLVAAARDAGLVTRGLMTVGPPGPPEAAKPGFELVAALARDLGLAEVSMGMSDDIEVAVKAGSTMLRVGRALFGPRPHDGPKAAPT